MTDKEKRELKDSIINIFKRFNILGNTASIGELRNNILRCIDSIQEEPDEDLEEVSKNYALNNTPWDDCKDEIQESFKAGAKWEKAKNESYSNDLGDYINELSKQFPEVSFAKLSRIAVRVANWQKEQIEEALLSKVLPCFMHGGEADEVMAKLDEVLNQKR